MMTLPAAAMALLLATSAAPSPEAHRAWLTSVDEATAAASRTGHHILVDLYADWCGWCRVLEQKVFTTPEFQSFASDFVLLRVDVEDGGEGSELQARYGATSLPTLLILDPKMVKVGEVTGFAPTGPYIAKIRDKLALHRQLLDLYERTLEAGDMAALQQIAAELHSRGDGARAATIYERVKEMLPEDARGKAWINYLLADAYTLDGSLDRARALLGQARRQVPDGGDPELEEKIDLLSFDIAQKSGDCDAAIAALEAFLRDHPASGFVRQARRSLDALRSGKVLQCA